MNTDGDRIRLFPGANITSALLLPPSRSSHDSDIGVVRAPLSKQEDGWFDLSLSLRRNFTLDSDRPGRAANSDRYRSSVKSFLMSSIPRRTDYSRFPSLTLVHIARAG